MLYGSIRIIPRVIHEWVQVLCLILIGLLEGIAILLGLLLLEGVATLKGLLLLLAKIEIIIILLRKSLHLVLWLNIIGILVYLERERFGLLLELHGLIIILEDVLSVPKTWIGTNIHTQIRYLFR